MITNIDHDVLFKYLKHKMFYFLKINLLTNNIITVQYLLYLVDTVDSDLLLDLC